MFGLAILDVAIGVVFVYILVSIICSAVREGLEMWLKTRAAYLEQGIRELLQGGASSATAEAVYRHPLIYGLFSGGYTAPAATGKPARPSLFARGGGLPSYIPSRNFALALLDLAARGPVTDSAATSAEAAPLTLDSVRMGIGNIGNPAVQRVLLTALDAAEGDLETAVANIQAWYDSAMDRVSGWYKRSTQKIILGIAVVVAVGMNVDTIRIARYLYQDEAARAAVVAVAEKADPNNPGDYTAAKEQLSALDLPIGWEGYVFHPMAILGWLLTALAATMGAPFWFDVLNKIMVIRSTVKPREKSPEEGSEDRQTQALRVLATGGGGRTASVPVDDTELDAFGVAGSGDPTDDDQLPPAQGGVEK